MTTLADRDRDRNVQVVDLADHYDHADIALSRVARLCDALGDRKTADVVIELLTALRKAVPTDLHLRAAEARDALTEALPF